MENLRDLKRKEIDHIRQADRAHLVDEHRTIEEVDEIKTTEAMKSVAIKLSQKSLVTPELLIALKNALPRSDDMKRAFLSVNAALPVLCKLTVTGDDARLALLATHCLGNLAAGADEKLCVRLAKAAGSSLAMRTSGMCYNLIEGSVWAIGNISAHRRSTELMAQQGVYKSIIKLLASSNVKEVKNAALYCLIHALRSAPSTFTSEDYVSITTSILHEPQLEETGAFLLHLASHIPAVSQLMIERGLHISALGLLLEKLTDDLNEKNESIAMIFPLVRILGNLSAESSGIAATHLLENSTVLMEVSQLLLSCSLPELQKEAAWFLTNIIQHPNSQVQNASRQVGLTNVCCVNPNFMSMS